MSLEVKPLLSLTTHRPCRCSAISDRHVAAPAGGGTQLRVIADEVVHMHHIERVKREVE